MAGRGAGGAGAPPDASPARTGPGGGAGDQGRVVAGRGAGGAGAPPGEALPGNALPPLECDASARGDSHTQGSADRSPCPCSRPCHTGRGGRGGRDLPCHPGRRAVVALATRHSPGTRHIEHVRIELIRAGGGVHVRSERRQLLRSGGLRTVVDGPMGAFRKQRPACRPMEAR